MWTSVQWGLILMLYSVTLTWSHAVVVVRVLTVETGSSPMETDCHFLVMCMRVVVLNECLCDTQAVVAHLVYIVVILRLLQSIIMMAMRLCMLDCIPVEVSVVCSYTYFLLFKNYS